MAALAVAFGIRSAFPAPSPSATPRGGHRRGDDGPLPTTETTMTAGEKTPKSVPRAPPLRRVSPSRRRVCGALGRLSAHNNRDSPDPLDRSLGPGTPELFEFLGLDGSAPPFLPAPDTAQPGQPAHKAARNAIRLGRSAFRAGRRRPEPDPGHGRGGAEERIDPGGGDRRAVDEEGLVHTVARVLWDDDTRRDYVKHVLPVLRLRAESEEQRPAWFEWLSKPATAGDAWDAVCPLSARESD
ncbi:LOW QUALITY PROTEIN: hypothetical protein Ct61P_15456 [Colletotrichum tofieldiae]|nr:LOW QUALITY PROTEIN: hypothetical protein Ct61P_15456 [Colletotrichum tofieldiae]